MAVWSIAAEFPNPAGSGFYPLRMKWLALEQKNGRRKTESFHCVKGRPAMLFSASLDLHQRLLHGGFRPSNPLRTASRLLLLAGTRKCQALANFFQLAENFHHRKLSIRSSHWVELAGLALCPERMSNVVDRVIELQAGLMELKPVVSQKTSVSLACQLALTEYGRDPAANALIPNWKAVIMLLGVSNLLGQRRSF